MIVTIIVIIGIVILVWFFSDIKEQNKQIEKSGGMAVKYALIINSVLENNSDAKIHKQGKSYITFGEVSNLYGSILFNIQENIDSTIKIKFNSNTENGIVSLEWSYKKGTDLKLILNKILIDVDARSRKNITANDVSNNSLIDTQLNGLDNYYSLFIEDEINIDKYFENLDIIKNGGFSFNDELGTASVRKIELPPPMGFSLFFVAAYPDVYRWAQRKHSSEIHAISNLNTLSESEVKYIFSTPKKLMEFYRSLINQYKQEKNTLECSQ